MKLKTVITTFFIGFSTGGICGLPIATARPSKQPTPKPSCPRGLSVTWGPSSPSSIPEAQWLCCKNSDKIGDCKVGQAPFPYGPRRKLVCCQCPTGQVLNKDKNGCLPTGLPTPSLTPTAKPTSALTAVPTSPPGAAPTSSPTAASTSPPTAASTSPPTAASTSPPTAVPTSPPTAVPTRVPAEVPTYLPTTSDTSPPTEEGTPPPPTCDRGYKIVGGVELKELINGNLFKLKADFQMCCMKKNVVTCPERDRVLTRDVPNEYCCYCIKPASWVNAVVRLGIVPGYCAA